MNTNVYINRETVARFILPTDLLEEGEKLESHRRDAGACCGGIEVGKVKHHGPHKDCWYGIPNDTIDIWIAMSEVIPGNGLTVFLEMFGKEVGHNGVVMDDAQSTGAPPSFRLQKGDILLFNGDHLHASEINRTGRTRYVISLRFYVCRPIFTSYSPPNQRYYRSSFIGTPFETIFSVPSYFAWRTIQSLKRRMTLKLGL